MALVAAAAAAVLAVVLGPRVIDGELVQAELRGLVQEATGRDLVVQGRIGVDLFPRLRLSLARVVIGNPLAAAEPVRIDADRVDLEVAPLTVLAGRLVVRRARVVRPRIRLHAPATGPLVAGTLQALSAPSLQDLEVVQLVDGRIERAGVADGPPRTFLEEIDGTLRRDTLLRRVAVSLSGSAAEAPFQLQAEIGEPSPGTATSLRFEVIQGAGGHHTKLDFRGFGTLDAATPSLKGEFELDAAEPAGIHRLVSLVTPIHPPARLPRTAPILLDGQVELAGETLRLSEVTARVGPNTIDAQAEVRLGPMPRLALDLAGDELVADASTVDDLRSLLSLPWWTTHVDGHVEARLTLVRWRSLPIRQLRAELRFGASGIQVDRLTASLPGTADLSITGQLRPDYDGPRFTGSLALSAEEARATLAALGLATDLLPRGGLNALSLTSELAAARSSLALRNFELRVDGARLSGSAALVPGLRPRFTVSAVADRLDLDLYLPRPQALAAMRLQDRLTAFDMAVDLSAARAGLGDLWGDGLYLRVLLEQGSFKLSELSVDDLMEARLHLAGSGDLPVDRFELAGELVAERPVRLLRALGLEAPATATRFAPVRILGTAHGNRATSEVELDVAGAGLAATLTASLGPWLTGTPAAASLQLQLDELREALRNLGLVPPEFQGMDRPFGFTGRLERVGEGHELAFEASAAPSRVEGRLKLGRMHGEPVVSGRLDSELLERHLLAAMLELAPAWLDAPQLVEPAAWLGRLPAVPVAAGGLPDLELELEAARLVGFEQPVRAAARLKVSKGDLSLDRLDLPLAGGTLTGVATLTAGAAGGILGLDMTLSGARAERLLAAAGLEPALTGELDLAAELAGSGGTLPELVQSLEGEAELSLRDGMMPGLLPTREAAMPFSGIGGGLHLSRGIATTGAGGLSLVGPDLAGRIALQLDLAAWMAVIGVRLAPVAEGAKAITHRFVGAPGRLQRSPSERAPARAPLIPG